MALTKESTQWRPQSARLIPNELWRSTDAFDSTASDEELTLLTADLADIHPYKTPHTNPIKSWLCLLLGHQQSSADALLDAAKQLSLSPAVIFQGAILANRVDLLNQLKGEPTNNLQEMIAALDVFDWYKTNVRHVRDMITTDDFAAFRLAASSGHIAVLNWIKAELPHQLQAMIAANDYEVFQVASNNGHLEVLKWLKDEAPQQFQDMITAYNYLAFSEAANGGHFEILNWMIEAAPDKLNDMIKAVRYETNYNNSPTHYLDFLNWVKNNAASLLPEMIIKGLRYEAHMSSSSRGYIDLLNWVKNEAPDCVQEVIATDEYAAFRYAALSGRMNALHWLEAEAPDKLQAMIAANHYAAFTTAAERHYDDVVYSLLSNISCFAYAEMQEREYATRYVHPFIAEKLSTLRTLQQQAKHYNDNTVFDLTDMKESLFCFYMLRNLIRRNDPALDKDIEFLLNIPSVKKLAHQEITPNVPNELLRLALAKGNQNAAKILLDIAEVCKLAEEKDYYHDEAFAQTVIGHPALLILSKENNKHELPKRINKEVSMPNPATLVCPEKKAQDIEQETPDESAKPGGKI